MAIPLRFTGAEIQRIQRLDYTYAKKGRILMPLRHAMLVEDISKQPIISSKIELERHSNAILINQAACNTRLLVEMFEAVSFLFRATDPRISITEPELTPKEGFFIYQMLRNTLTLGKMPVQHLIILPDGRLPLHYHETYKETFKFIDSVTFHINGKEIQVPENSFKSVPIGSVHGTVPSGDRFIRAVAMKLPRVKNVLVKDDFHLVE
ncbi:MAG: hypothetical protein WCY41_00070 [Candidatus Micrarchaeia archaeon]